MKTRFTRFLSGLFATGLISLQMCVAQDDSAIVSERFKLALDAQIDQEFDALAGFIHPFTLRFFRDRLNVTYEQLVERYPEKDVLKAIGIDVSPSKSGLTDKDLFVTLCTRAVELQPDFTGDEKYLPVKVHGVVFGENDEAYLVYDYSEKSESTKSAVEFKRPSLSVFVKTGNGWLMKSMVFTNILPTLWERELARLRAKEPIGQEDGVDPPVAAPKAKSGG